MKIFPLLALAAFLPASGFAQDSWPALSEPPAAVGGGGERDAAVIVGIENYLVVPRISGARRNARAWHSYLTESLKVPWDRVALLEDNDATVEGVRRAVADKAASVEEGGTLWFVFIGHGAPSRDGKDGLLVGVDAQEKVDSVYERSLSESGLLALLARGRQKKTVVLLDACFSGRTPAGSALIKDLQPLVLVRERRDAGDSRTILMAAARPDQFAGPLPKAADPRPAFSYLALGALRGWAADSKGRVTAGGVVDFARKALKLASDRTQTPELALGDARTVLALGHERSPDMARIAREESAPRRTGGVLEEPKPLEPHRRIRVRPGRKGKAGIEWMALPAGTFKSAPVQGFEMAKTQVTVKQYQACVDAGVCAAPHWSDGACFIFDGSAWKTGNSPEKFQGADQPVVCVDWEQAETFSKWAGGRLPTAAEREYAARSAGMDVLYPWGNDEATCARAVIWPNQDFAQKGCGRVSTWPVCSKKEGNTEQGLCDMAGNAFDWIADWDQASGNTKRVIAGGSWNDVPQEHRAAYRASRPPGSIQENIGFRPVRQSP